ncbi:MAG: hypothetical protein IPJ65_05335 [Archangiaceae bacterium]|nr:hypothetical protein [Archangiaceae bacterium]
MATCLHCGATMFRPSWVTLLCSAVLFACPGRDLPLDGGPGDGGSEIDLPDAGDGGARADAGRDGGSDGGVDAGTDAGTEGCDAGLCIRVLDVIQCPQLTLEYGCTVLFPRVPLGSSSTETVTLASTGTLPVHVTSATLSSSEFSLMSSIDVTLAPLQNLVVPVLYRPTDAGTFRATLKIASSSDYLPLREVVVMGGTPNAACTGEGQCLLAESCSGTECQSCVQISPPGCAGGRIIGMVGVDGCLNPVCRCADDQIWVSGACVSRVACTADGGCSSGSCNQNACCSAPSCLCPVAPACR